MLVLSRQEFAPVILRPDQARLGESSQHVKVTNTGEKQRHVVEDRYRKGHEIGPGETKDIEMLDRDIAYFDGLRMPGRMDANGKPLPKHPIRVEGEEGRAQRRGAAPTTPQPASENAPTGNVEGGNHQQSRPPAAAGLTRRGGPHP